MAINKWVWLFVWIGLFVYARKAKMKKEYEKKIEIIEKTKTPKR